MEIHRLKSLIQMAINPKVREMVSAFNAYFGEEFVCLQGQSVLIHFPTKTVVLNSDHTKRINITDLYVMLNFTARVDSGITITRIQGNVGSYSALQYQNNYRHSHLQSGRENKGFGDFCLGNSELSVMKNRSGNRIFSYDDFFLMANMIDIFMGCEGASPFIHITQGTAVRGGVEQTRPRLTSEEAGRIIMDLGYFPDFSYAEGANPITPCVSEDYLFEFAKKLDKHHLGIYNTEKGYADEFVYEDNNDAYLITLRHGTIPDKFIKFKREQRPIVIHPPVLSTDPLRRATEVLVDFPTPTTVNVIKEVILEIYNEKIRDIFGSPDRVVRYAENYKRVHPISDKLILNHLLNKNR